MSVFGIFLVRIFPQENKYQKNSEYGHFSHSAASLINWGQKIWINIILNKYSSLLTERGSSFFHAIPACIYLFKFENRKWCVICSKLNIKTSEWCPWRQFDVFIVNFEYISHLFLVFLLFTLNKWMLVGRVLVQSKKFKIWKCFNSMQNSYMCCFNKLPLKHHKLNHHYVTMAAVAILLYYYVTFLI